MVIELFWIFVVVLCSVCGIAVIVLSIYVEYKNGGTELFFLFFTGCGTALFAYIGSQYGGGDIARLAGVIGCIISIVAYYVAVAVYIFIFYSFPGRRKCKLRTCHPHYYNWIPIQDDIWYRECYVCHQEYVLFCFKYEATVNADGTLKPYLKRTKLGWRRDDGADSKEILASITPDAVDQIRKKSKELQDDSNC